MLRKMPKPKTPTSRTAATAVITVSHWACTFSSTVAVSAIRTPEVLASDIVRLTVPFATDCTGTVVRVDDSGWTFTSMSLRTIRSAEFDGCTDRRTVTGHFELFRIEIGSEDRSPSRVRLLESTMPTWVMVSAQAATRASTAAGSSSGCARHAFDASASRLSRAGAVTAVACPRRWRSR